MKQITKYAATDGTEHNTPDECREHEDAQAIDALADRKIPDFHDAISGKDRVLRDAIRRVFGLIQAARYEAGEVKPRGSKKAVQPAPTVAKEPRKARAA